MQVSEPCVTCVGFVTLVFEKGQTAVVLKATHIE